MEKKPQQNVSENEDDPETYESSGEEWIEEEQPPKKGGGNRRASQRISKRPKVTHVDYSSDEDEKKKKNTTTAATPKSKNGVKKQKVEEVPPEAVEEEEEDSDSDSSSSESTSSKDEGGTKKSSSNKLKLNNSDFVNGGFLISKKDAQLKPDSEKLPCLWRIDGKALLQKYEPFKEDELVKHRNTSVYTGWSTMDKDLYHPVTVKVLQHQGQNLIVELNWEKLKEINNESE